MNSEYSTAILKAGRDASMRHRHPWIFSGAIEKFDGKPATGDIVRVNSHDGATLGFGHFADESIAIKILSFAQTFDPANFWTDALQSAVALRHKLGFFSDTATTGFRLVNAEGDGLPGLIIDVYGATAVLQFHSAGMLAAKQQIGSALRSALEDRLTGVYAQGERDDQAGEFLWGQGGEPIFSEHGLRYEVDWVNGQKTGFFLDQRENRYLLRSYCRDAKVLNCFSYSGGFTLSAMKGGAREVVSVDSSKQALELLGRNLELNELAEPHRELEADCLHYLQNIEPDFDCIVLDPPAFIKHRGALRGGIKGYESINHQAIRQIKKSGILFTFSCSQLLTRQDFLEVIQRAAVRAGRRVRILHQLHQAPCHPVQASHPEGEYLKGFVLEVS